MATAVPTKGSTRRFSVDKVLDYLEVGDRNSQVIMKTDQEPSITSLIDDVVAAREEGRSIVEEAPHKSSWSNVVAERAVRK